MIDISPSLAVEAYFLGRRIAGQRKRVPVAYLYNGVRLPPLPEWDRVAYPYAYINGYLKRTGVMGYYFNVCENPLVYKEVLNLPSVSEKIRVVSVYGYGCIFDYKDENWELRDKDELLSHYNKEDDMLFFWTNHDIISEIDGTIYLAASDPIPVYE